MLRALRAHAWRRVARRVWASWPGRRPPAGLVLALPIAGLGLGGFWAGTRPLAPQERSIAVIARKYAYEPPVIRVNKGDTLRLRFASMDVVHGFYLEGHDADVRILPMQTAVEVHHPSRPGESRLAEELVIVANREGKFRYRCSHTCGFMHPFMLGELVVGPNRLLPASMGMAAGLLLGGFLVVLMKPEH